ncbi:hypothetical protein EBZ39_17600, partial [bacterium]|nr:hypothetical protein [bacterium]
VPFNGKRQTIIKASDYLRALVKFAISRDSIITDVDTNHNDSWSFAMNKRNSRRQSCYLISPHRKE